MIDTLRQFFNAHFADALIREVEFRGQHSFYIRPDSVVALCESLSTDPELKVNLLADITAVDWLGHEDEMVGRFEVVYNLYSIENQFRFFVKVMLPAENPEIDSLTSLWRGADWLEREVWDMFGVTFVGHPDLTKILTPDELEGHPLRRDFPLTYEVPQFSWNKDDPPEVIK